MLRAEGNAFRTLTAVRRRDRRAEPRQADLPQTQREKRRRRKWRYDSVSCATTFSAVFIHLLWMLEHNRWVKHDTESDTIVEVHELFLAAKINHALKVVFSGDRL